MLEYIEKMFVDGIHLQSNPQIHNNGFCQLDFSNNQTKTAIRVQLKKMEENERVIEYEIADVLRAIGFSDNGQKIYQQIEMPEHMFNKNLYFYKEINAFGNSGTLAY